MLNSSDIKEQSQNSSTDWVRIVVLCAIITTIIVILVKLPRSVENGQIPDNKEVNLSVKEATKTEDLLPEKTVTIVANNEVIVVDPPVVVVPTEVITPDVVLNIEQDIPGPTAPRPPSIGFIASKVPVTPIAQLPEPVTPSPVTPIVTTTIPTVGPIQASGRRIVGPVSMSTGTYTDFMFTRNDFIPAHAFNFRPVIYYEINRFFPSLPDINYVPSLIEHESCITLRHSRCWRSTSQLRSAREQGVGLGQVTRAFREDGSVRFDTLTNLRNMYREELREASWDTIKDRPDIQIRMIVLLLRSDFNQLHNITDPMQRLKFTNAAYNGGIRDVHRSRRACGLSNDCDSQLWFNNVERFNVKSTKALYGTRSARDINNHHVKDVFKNNLPKYRAGFFTKEWLNAQR